MASLDACRSRQLRQAARRVPGREVPGPRRRSSTTGRQPRCGRQEKNDGSVEDARQLTFERLSRARWNRPAGRHGVSRFPRLAARARRASFRAGQDREAGNIARRGKTTKRRRRVEQRRSSTAYNDHLSGKILIPQPFATLRNLYETGVGLRDLEVSADRDRRRPDPGAALLAVRQRGLSMASRPRASSGTCSKSSWSSFATRSPGRCSARTIMGTTTNTAHGPCEHGMRTHDARRTRTRRRACAARAQHADPATQLPAAACGRSSSSSWAAT